MRNRKDKRLDCESDDGGEGEEKVFGTDIILPLYWFIFAMSTVPFWRQAFLKTYFWCHTKSASLHCEICG